MNSAIFHLFASSCTSLTGTSCDTGLPNANPSTNTIQTVLGMIFAIIAVVAVLMIVIAGLRFITGSSNPQEISKAKNTIIYALVGLMIALAAESIVRLVVGHL